VLSPQPGQVLLKLEDPSQVQPQPLPDRVTALHNRIEGADSGLVAVHQAPPDVDDEVTVALFVALLHAPS